jgi:hypothetical protein
MGQFQTVVTAVMANHREGIDGIELQVQELGTQDEEALDVRATVQES